jgi:hypothetical protein
MPLITNSGVVYSRANPTYHNAPPRWLLESMIDERREELLDNRERIFDDHLGDPSPETIPRATEVYYPY